MKNRKINIELTEGAYDSLVMLITLSGRLKDFVIADIDTNELSKGFIERFFGDHKRMKEFLEFIEDMTNKSHSKETNWCKDPNCPEKQVKN